MSFNWHDDPSQEVRALPQDILYTMLSRPSSSCSTSLWPFSLSHSRTCPCAELAVSSRIFPSTLPNRLTSPCGLGASAHLWSASHCCAAKARPPPFFGVTCCHLPSVPNRLTFSASSKIDLAHAFCDSEWFPTFFAGSAHSKSCP